MPRHSNQLLELARRGGASLRELQEELHGLVAHFPHLRTLMPVGEPAAAAVRGPVRRQRTMSATARRRISEAQTARWAARKGAQPSAQTAASEQPTTSTRRRGGMSAAARRAVSDAMNKYWAERRNAKHK